MKRLDLSDALIVLGLALAGASLWQLSPWLAGALGGAVLTAVGIRTARP